MGRGGGVTRLGGLGVNALVNPVSTRSGHDCRRFIVKWSLILAASTTTTPPGAAEVLAPYIKTVSSLSFFVCLASNL